MLKSRCLPAPFGITSDMGTALMLTSRSCSSNLVSVYRSALSSACTIASSTWCVCSTSMSNTVVLPWCRCPATATFRTRLALPMRPRRYSSLTFNSSAFLPRSASICFFFTGAMMGSSSGCASSSMISVSVPGPYTSSAVG